MSIPEEFRRDFAAFPPALQALIEAELRAGNEIAELGHSFPAPPVGAYFKLTRPVTTRAKDATDGLNYRARRSSLSAGEYTDAQRHFFVLEPPDPADGAYPDMNAIRAAHDEPPPPVPPKVWAFPGSALDRFERSMVIDYEKWHDGIGYDLDALKAATATQRHRIEALLLQRGALDWRDVEALAILDTPAAEAALKTALHNGSHEIRLAVMRHAPGIVADEQRTALLIAALKGADIYSGLSQALAAVEKFHPPIVIDALLRGALERSGDVAVHLAAMLFFLHGKAPEPFDMAQRPFFLRFNTPDRKARETVFAEMCATIGVPAENYL